MLLPFFICVTYDGFKFTQFYCPAAILVNTCSHKQIRRKGFESRLHATTELRLLLLDVVEAAAKWWPRAEIWLYVDDLTVSVNGSRRRVAVDVAGVVDFVCLLFTRVL